MYLAIFRVTNCNHDISSLVTKSFIQLYIIACSFHYGIIDILERVKDVFLRFSLPNVEVNKQAHASCTILPVMLSQLLLITTTRCSAHSKVSTELCAGSKVRSRSSFNNSSQIFLKQT